MINHYTFRNLKNRFVESTNVHRSAVSTTGSIDDSDDDDVIIGGYRKDFKNDSSLKDKGS